MESQIKRKSLGEYKNAIRQSKMPPPCLSQRWILAYMLFFCIWLLYGVRSNMSMSIPCMVKPEPFNVQKQNISRDTTDSDRCMEISQHEVESSKHFEFTWDKSTESMVLSASYFGYIFTPLPSGILADRYGGKRVITVSMTVLCILTLVTPLAARHSVETLIGVRILLGAAAGPVFSGVFSLWSKWAPRNEATSLQIFTITGFCIGTCATFSVSGFLCESGFDNGWTTIFYFTGLTVLIWLVPWVLTSADSPRQHRRISVMELNYIETNTGDTGKPKLNRATFKAIISSNAFWASVTAHFCSNWIFYTYMTVLPLYMQEVLKFDIKKNGLLSSLPILCPCLSGLISSFVADKLRSTGKLSTKMTRKVFQSIGSFGTAFGSVAIGYISCDDREFAVILLCISLTLYGVQWSGYGPNHVDYAPRYAGMIFGISNTVATIPGIISPLITGFITQNKTREEWRNIFFISSGISLFGGAVFLLFAEGEVQKWARHQNEKNNESVVHPEPTPKYNNKANVHRDYTYDFHLEH